MSAGSRSAGILLNYLTDGIRVLSVLLVTPWMLRLLGQREYGIYQLAASMVSWLSLLNLGFGSSYLRGYSRCRVQGDDTALARFHGMYLLIFGVLAGVSLLCGGILMGQAELVFGSLTQEERQRAQWLLGLLTLNLAVTLLNTPFDGYLSAREQFVFQRLLRLAQAVLSPWLTLFLLLLGYGSEAMALVSLTLSATLLGITGYRCRKLGMKISFHQLPLSQLRELWYFAFFILLNQLIDQINWNLDKLLLGHLQDAAAVAVYSVGAQFHSLFLQLSTGISAVFLPKVNRIAAQTEENRELSRLLAQVGRLQGMVLGWVFGGFLFFGRPFVRLWAGSGYERANAVALLLMGSAFIPLVQNLGIEIQRARNAHRTRSLVYACLALGNLFLSLHWIPRWGEIGAAAATAVFLLLGNGLFMNWYYQVRLKLDMGLYWRRISGLVPGWAAAFGAGAAIALPGRICSWAGLLTAAGLYSLIYAGALWWFSLEREEKQWIFSRISKRKRGQA